MGNGDVRMTDAEFRMIGDLVRRRCGLHFGPESRYLVERRLARRVTELSLPSFTAYHYLLRRDESGDGEMGWAIDVLTTNETYFLRERKQLRALIDEVIPALRAEPDGQDRPVSIWSAGCSSGEEPYSIVMLGLEAGLEPGHDFRVYASDISRPMLRKARRGLYRDASFRETEPSIIGRYFEPMDGLHRISDEVRKHVHFAHLNLLDTERTGLLGAIDVVLCRNVLIYFDLEVKRRAVRLFHEKLRPGGYLLLGHSESLIQLSRDFELRHLENDMVYHRPPEESAWQRAARQAVEALDEEPDW